MKNYKSGKTQWEVTHPEKIFSLSSIHSKDALITWSQNDDINFWKIKKNNPLIK